MFRASEIGFISLLQWYDHSPRARHPGMQSQLGFRKHPYGQRSGGDGIPAELFQILKMMLLKCCTQYASRLEHSVVATGLEKISFHSNSKER